MLRKSFSLALCAALAVAPVAAQAQFGGLGKGLLGGGGGGESGGVSSADAGAFLDNALKSTKNVMISAALLSQALADRGDLSQAKARVDAISQIQTFKEADALKQPLERDLAALTSRKDLAADINAKYQAGDAHQKQLIGMALGNLAIGVFRNVKLAGQAPGMVSGVGNNPMMLRRVGELKLAAGLLGLTCPPLVPRS